MTKRYRKKLKLDKWQELLYRTASYAVVREKADLLFGFEERITVFLISSNGAGEGYTCKTAEEAIARANELQRIYPARMRQFSARMRRFDPKAERRPYSWNGKS